MNGISLFTHNSASYDPAVAMLGENGKAAMQYYKSTDRESEIINEIETSAMTGHTAVKEKLWSVNKAGRAWVQVGK